MLLIGRVLGGYLLDDTKFKHTGVHYYSKNHTKVILKFLKILQFIKYNIFINKINHKNQSTTQNGALTFLSVCGIVNVNFDWF